MYLNPFDGARAKLGRSKEHFDELVRAEREYREQQPVHIEQRSDDGGTLVFAVADKLPGLREATIVADILGNFRSSLDLAVCEAARIAGATNLSKTYFHFASTEQEWDKSVKDRMKAAPGHIRSVVRALQPWANGNGILYALSKLAVADKHRLLVSTAGHTRELVFDGFRLTDMDGNPGAASPVGLRIPIWKPGEREAELMHVGPGSKVVVGGPIVLSLMFSFGDVDLVPFQPVIPLLNQMGGMCEHAIELIERASA